MKNAVLSAKKLCKSFAHNGSQVHILSHVDLDLYEGDFTVIMGASGSGKSTLLYALSGMDRATSGEVIYDGRDIVRLKEKDLARLRYTDFGFIFQQMHLVSNLTLFENVAVPGYLNKGKPAAEVRKRADKLLEQMSASHIKDHLPTQVSGGEQQRCAVARAVINSPRVIFADEPTGSVSLVQHLQLHDFSGTLLTFDKCGGICYNEYTKGSTTDRRSALKISYKEVTLPLAGAVTFLCGLCMLSKSTR